MWVLMMWVIPIIRVNYVQPSWDCNLLWIRGGSSRVILYSLLVTVNWRSICLQGNGSVGMMIFMRRCRR